MKLEHITEEVCPHCGAVVIREYRTENPTHVNGQHRETRKFACEFEIEYIPNFKDTRWSGTCTRSSEYLEREERKEMAIAQLCKCVSKLDIDKEFKEGLLQRINSM